MRRLKLVVEYDGTDFRGFAIQSSHRTVQGELEGVLGRLTGTPTRVAGSGRTDAGVHALGQVVSFSTASRLESWEMHRALNALLPRDIVVKSVEQVAEGFHARWSAVERHYRYSVWNNPLPSVLHRRYSYQVPDALNLEAMNEASRLVEGTRDYACFTFGLSRYLSSGQRRSTVRTVNSAGWHGDGPEVQFDIVGTAFLPHMIRNIVGSILKVGHGTWTAEEFRRMLDEGATELSNSTVPALGLMLVGVEY